MPHFLINAVASMFMVSIFLLDKKWHFFYVIYVIIYIHINSLKLNLRRYDSGAVYRCYFSVLKCYLRSIYDFRR